MLVVMRKDANQKEIEIVCKEIKEMGLAAHPIPGAQRTAIGITGNKNMVREDKIMLLPGVKEIIHVTQPYKLVGREFKPDDTVIETSNVKIGGKKIVIIAGPCAVESREQIIETAFAVKEAGAHILRGGAFKPRTSPYDFQGMGEEGLELLAEAREKTGLLIVTETIDPDNVEIVEKYADILQIGARNMHSFSLLRRVGRSKRPVLLKRGLAATIKEFLMAAEYIMSEGNPNIILCERGVRTFGDHTRFTLDLSAIPVIKELTHLPIIADPSHATGKWQNVTSMARASIAAGADGVMIEVHPHPEFALSDGSQSLTPENFNKLIKEMKIITEAIGKEM
ncbi:MAG: 3-deoxy-7-phosphoheptulonate synthase [Candidatus Stahlbacteria bacterium]|nr:3-deoxy-7-phosphoheptulonate synthase [Candidatus Stahlbacteria bacterium]